MTTKLSFTCKEVSTLASTVEFLQRWGFELVDQQFKVEVELTLEEQNKNPSTINSWVLHFLLKGPASTKEIWDFLQSQNKATSSARTLAPYLSRFKKAGVIYRYGKRLWCLTAKA